MIKAWCIKHTSFSLKTDLSKPEGVSETDTSLNAECAEATMKAVHSTNQHLRVQAKIYRK